ncbi:FkbM family methyltransferase [Paracoccaceae bacterium]|nr:FkbM family methyltransferase [Paracoccaceae bacterium]
MKTNFGKGLLAFSEGKYEHAFTFFEKSHRENIPPDKHLTLYNMGLSLIFLEDLVPAKDYFFNALRYLPNHSDSLHWIAYIDFRKGQLSTAQDHYLSSLKSHPRSHTSISGCIHFFIEQGLNGEEINVLLNKNGVQLKESESFYLKLADPVDVSIDSQISFPLKGIDPRSTMQKSINNYGCYEPLMVKKILTNVQERDIVYDIGAHIGYYSSIFNNVTKSKEVVSLEPDFYSSNLIKKNTNKRGIVVNKFIGSELSHNTTTLNDLSSTLNLEPSVIKMDIEGFEVEAFEGGWEIIRNLRPQIFLEIHPKFIHKRHPRAFEKLVDELFKLYNIEYARNHWGQIKGEETFQSEWEKATPDILCKIANEIIFNDQKPNAFAIHCS